MQATKFGAEVAAPREVAGLDISTRPFALDIGGGQSVRGRTVVIATGAKLAVHTADRHGLEEPDAMSAPRTGDSITHAVSAIAMTADQRAAILQPRDQGRHRPRVAGIAEACCQRHTSP